MATASIPASLPRGSGHQFVVYGDCCSGIPGTSYETTFAAVNAVLRRLTPQPEFILFAGDHIMGSPDETAALREQWRYFFEHEVKWLDRKAVPMFSCTSNHNTRSAVGEAVFREVFAGFPRNGPPEQQGLCYWIRRGDLLVVVVNTSFSGLGGNGHVETRWLDAVLTENADAKQKLVMGHYPAWPVNGYSESPLWCIVPEEARAFWHVLVKHGVAAYLCSHVIAFDVQQHEGVLQLTTGGAGTKYGPGGFMDGPAEYHHLVQVALDEQGMRCQAIDLEGRMREQVEWSRGKALKQAVVAAAV